MGRPLRHESFTDWMPEVNVLDNSAHQNLILAMDYAELKYGRECWEFYVYLRDKHLLSGSEEDQFKLKVASAILTMRSLNVPLNAESVLCLNVVIDRFIPGINPISQAERTLSIVTSIADILSVEINMESIATSHELGDEENDQFMESIATSHELDEEEDDHYVGDDSLDDFDDESIPDYDGESDFDQEMVTPEFARTILEFSSLRSLSDFARTFISFSEDVSQIGQPFFGVIYSWHSDNPLIELADAIKLQQELAWIQEQRANVIHALNAFEKEPLDTELQDNFVAQADDLLEKLTTWLTELTGLSEDLWYQILNQMSELDSFEVNYFNLFLQIGMEACRFEPGESRPDFTIGQVINLGGLDPNGYPQDMLIKKYPVINN